MEDPVPARAPSLACCAVTCEAWEAGREGGRSWSYRTLLLDRDWTQHWTERV